MSWAKGKFQDRCIAVDSLCGTPCGASIPGNSGNDVCVKQEVTQLDGTIRTTYKLPEKLLIDEKVANMTRHPNKYDVNKDVRWKDTHREGGISVVYHWCFITLMTVSALSALISFLPGIGNDYDPPRPSMQEVEEHMQYSFLQSKEGDQLGPDPLCLVAFSISAGESRMMVLRNLCGKMMAWVKVGARRPLSSWRISS